ncbi:MAG: beta-ketoacyl synthase N-terminal-like domain-containing protein, partial [Limisphaerales bacterium]
MSESQRDRRVVITGMGVVSPLGNTPESLWNHLLEGACGIDA